MRRKFIIFIGVFLIFLNTYAHAEEKFPSVDSPSIILIDSKTGQILYEKDANKKLYPASITKIMTALLALEKCKLDDKVIASKNAVFSIEPGSNTASFQPDEELTVEQLLYALMLNSANESANILAEHIGGSIQGFADIMNARAKELGAVNTHFVTPNGLHKDDHYTTAYDMALIARQAMAIPKFREIVSTVKYNMPPTNKYPKTDKVFLNSNKLINSTNENYYKYATGIKTGYTVKAGHTLVASAFNNGIELIAVSLNSRIGGGKLQNYTDSTNLFDYAFKNYKITEVVKAGSLVKQFSIKNAKKDAQLQVGAQTGVSFITPLDSEDYYTVNEVIRKDITAPIIKNTNVGYIEYLINGKVVGKTNVIALNNIEEYKPFAFVKIVYKILIAIIIIAVSALLILILMMIIWMKVQHRKIKPLNRVSQEKPKGMKIDRLMED
ncbi:MAG: D-alanyl-D-alanine carboxypeptidase family protein [Deltaproteobacteria bacterium]